MAIEHFPPCEQRLLGYVAQNFPHVTFTLQNLRDGAAKLRHHGKAPKCECARIQLATLDKRIHTAKVSGRPELVALLRTERRALEDAALSERKQRVNG